MTGEKQQLDLDQVEEAVDTDNDHVVPDPQEERSMVTTSGEVCIPVLVFCLRLVKYHKKNFFILVFTSLCCVVQVLEELGLDAANLVDEDPSLFEQTAQQHSDKNFTTLYCLIN